MRNGDEYEPSLARNSVSTVCKVPGTSLSPGRLKWALVTQRVVTRMDTSKSGISAETGTEYNYFPANSSTPYDQRPVFSVEVIV